MFTAEKADAFEQELQGLFKKYVTSEVSEEEQIIADSVVCNVLSDHAEMGFMDCEDDANALGMSIDETQARIGAIVDRLDQIRQARAIREELEKVASIFEALADDFNRHTHSTTGGPTQHPV